MGDAGRFDSASLLELGAEPVEEPSPTAEYRRDDMQPELVDEPCRELLVDAGAASDYAVLSGPGRASLIKGRLDPVRDEVNVVSESVRAPARGA